MTQTEFFSPISAVLKPRAMVLLGSIEAIILSDGFARLSISDLAERLSCSKRTIYEIAPTKNGLVLKVLGDFFAQIRTDAAFAATTQPLAAERLHDYLQAGVRAAQRLSQHTVTDIHRWQPALTLWKDHIRLRVAGLCALIEDGIRSGEFRAVKPTLVAELVFASLSRVREPEFYSVTQIPVAEAFHEYYRMLMAALLPTRSGSERLRSGVSRSEIWGARLGATGACRSRHNR